MLFGTSYRVRCVVHMGPKHTYAKEGIHKAYREEGSEKMKVVFKRFILFLNKHPYVTQNTLYIFMNG